jgi:uncharacterized protein (DUF849 family)
MAAKTATPGKPCIITVAITGSVPTKKDNPAVPVTVAEQIESTHAAFEAGATLAHIHVRKDDGSVSSDPDRFAQVQEGLKRHCPGMIIQFSTGGRSGVGSERGGMLHHRPDMASLSTGSCNFPLRIYENHPDLIRELAGKMTEYDVKPEVEAFDVSMMYQAIRMSEEGMLKKPIHIQFVMGVKNAMPCVRQVVEFQVAEMKRLQPEATWTVAGIGRHQIECNHWALEMGGHCRTGLEDNIRFDKTRLAKSNAELVARVASLCAEYGRPVATAKQAREMLGLRAA